MATRDQRLGNRLKYPITKIIETARPGRKAFFHNQRNFLKGRWIDYLDSFDRVCDWIGIKRVSKGIEALKSKMVERFQKRKLPPYVSLSEDFSFISIT